MTPPAPFNRMSRPEWLAYAKHPGYRIGYSAGTGGIGGRVARPGITVTVPLDSDWAEIEVETHISRDRLGPLVGPQWRSVVARELWEARQQARRLRMWTKPRSDEILKCTRCGAVGSGLVCHGDDCHRLPW